LLYWWRGGPSRINRQKSEISAGVARQQAETACQVTGERPNKKRRSFHLRIGRHPTVSAATQANTIFAKWHVDHAVHSQPVFVGLTVSRHGESCRLPDDFSRFSVISKMARGPKN